jgi:transcriptional regulator with XRE-family HTH domain
MAYSKTRTSDLTRAGRQKAGIRIRNLRKDAGYTQKELADKVGQAYYTFISQVETGYTRLPPEDYALWADALGVSTQVFVKDILRYYEPATFKALYPKEAAKTEVDPDQ